MISLIGYLASPLMVQATQWSTPPSLLSTTGQDASDPCIAIDPSGNALALWVESGIVMSSSGTQGGGWDTAEAISSTTASFPQVAMDGSGNAIAVWVENGVVRAKNKPVGQSWSGTETPLSLSGATAPQIAMNANGDAIAVWLSGREVTASTGSFSGGWNSSSTVSSSGGTASNPQLSIDSSGNGIIVWEQPVISTPSIYASTLASGSWSIPTMISASGVNSISPHVAITPSSTEQATAIWFTYDLSGSTYSNVGISTAILLSTGSWGASRSLASGGYMDPQQLTCAIEADSQGNAIAMWNTSLDGSMLSLQFAYKPSGGNWTSTPLLSPSNPCQWGFGLAVEPYGNALTSWMALDSTSNLVVSAEIASPSAQISQVRWQTPTILSQGASNGYPEVAINFSNNQIYTAACWLSSDGTTTSIQASLGTSSWPNPPTGLSVTQATANYNLVEDVYNTLSWTASSTSGVVSYQIYRNGELITTVGANINQWIDHNQGVNESVTYGVQTVASFQVLSEIATVTWP